MSRVRLGYREWSLFELFETASAMLQERQRDLDCRAAFNGVVMSLVHIKL
ncbi:hypothetical protein Plhal304r1_c022g0076671 [Plasmopara halstedii]